MKTENLLIALIAVLVIIAGVQALQIASVSNMVTKGVSVGEGSGSVAAGGVQKSSALAQLPTQVGGCG